jgi:nucleoside-diphosphate-sugar epimerase
MRVLVTGGAGFIGSHLTERLLARGDDVVVLDDLSTGSQENLAGVAGRKGFALEIGSALDPAVVDRCVADRDVVVHLAAAVGVRLIVERPVHTIETNVSGTAVVLAAAAKRGAKLLLASTSEVYGKGASVPFREEDDLTFGPTVNSRWSYACSKALDEWLAFAWWRERKLPVVVARLFNTVGPRQTGRYGMVLPNFAAQALKGEPITVFGSGAQTRCFGHVADAVEALLRLLDSGDAIGEVVNVGSDEEVTIEELAKRVKGAAQSASPITHVAYAEAYAAGFEDMPRRVPDLSKLERLTGFRPRTMLEKTIEDVLADQRARVERTSRGRW